MHKMYEGAGCSNQIMDVLREAGCSRPMLVTGKTFMETDIYRKLKLQYPNLISFSDFTVNPQYEDILRGTKFFCGYQCDFLIAAGGGSAIDTAKGIKAFSNMEKTAFCLQQEIKDNKIGFLAIPTTAGTGSEETPFGTLYYRGEKYSIRHESLIPSYVILDGTFLESLPLYQRKCTLMDALCHCIEALWSVNATDGSDENAEWALEIIVRAKEGYLRNVPEWNQSMLCAANFAGKAIAVSYTTAAHAMSYKMTSKFGIAHGHAVGLCIPKVWDYMYCHMEQLPLDKREKLEMNFSRIAGLLGAQSVADGIDYLNYFVKNILDMETPVLTDDACLDELVESVNEDRLRNTPILLDKEALRTIYRNIWRDKR